jgi:hypothetical protein
MKLQKFGGYAAIATLCVYFVNGVYEGRILPSGNWDDPAEIITAASTAPGGFYALNLLGMVCGILLLVTFVALHERMHADAPYLSSMILIAASASAAIAITGAIINITSIGTIVPARDLSALRACLALKKGLQFTGGHTCAWALLFVGCAILKTRSFSRALGWLTLVTSILWIPLFFLLQIEIRFIIPIIALMSTATIIWIGIALLRQKQLPPPAIETAAAN